MIYSIYATLALMIYVIWRFIRFNIATLASPLRNLPGPSSSSFIYGNFLEIWNADMSALHEEWVDRYGVTYAYKGFFSRSRLFTLDPAALGYILNNTSTFQKPDVVRHYLGLICGEGVLVAEGDEHRKQRRIMNPSFGSAQVRSLTSIFVDKAAQLRDIWLIQASTDEPVRIDVLSWLGKATLDVIGLAGFDYDFGSLEKDGTSELSEAFSVVFRAGQQLNILPILKAIIPPLRILHTSRDRKVRFAQDTMTRIGVQLIEQKKAFVRAEKTTDENIHKDDVKGRDLLSLLVRANLATDIPDSYRMSTKDIVAQIPTFLVAGHESTSIGVAWALFAIAQHQGVQKKLREDVLSLTCDNPNMDELQALPYLDAVLRETMRLHAPVPNTVRVATQDDVIPLSTPYIDRYGVKKTTIRVQSGDAIYIPILTMNRLKSIWGEDAHEFRPERWINSVPGTVSEVPGVWSNLLSFLGGPRNCIGHKFSVIEMKAIIFVLVRAFEFSLATKPEDIIKKWAIVARPVVASEPNEGNQLPLLVRPYRSAQ
ncbi:cytochrome P450 [Punctularia strigosozonata HHB-11173 SS5]|uniref:cytochrome P450 n=1 Tax=Punctularia strigosozonata (strain HHB-11173) TaxID=741275 RepID=UPI0004416A90|nr:cytochrome P450 [Punctularia strigosozonata HHB-11173 SS5]EIN09227.1 cytochrome P450 [Punctularia strigosozonata HHB-11173 SS5]